MILPQGIYNWRFPFPSDDPLMQHGINELWAELEPFFQTHGLTLWPSHGYGQAFIEPPDFIFPSSNGHEFYLERRRRSQNDYAFPVMVRLALLCDAMACGVLRNESDCRVF